MAEERVRETEESGMTDDDILWGWKEIERVMGLSMYVLKAHGYPVRRSPSGASRPRVWASRAELMCHARGLLHSARKIG